MLSTGFCIADLIAFFVTLSVIVVAYFKWNYQYWKRRNLPYLEPKVPFGNLGTLIGGTEHTGIKVKRIYDVMKKKGWKHGGIYAMSSPIYVPIDLEYVKNIMSKDFHHFASRGFYYNEEHDPLSANLFNIDGIKWRNLRTKLTPTFTSGRMKAMFQTLVDCEGNLQKKIQKEYEKGVPIDIKEVLACFTTDIIGSCAFGLDFNTFQQEDSLFRNYGKKLFDRDLFGNIKLSFVMTFPELSKKLNLEIIPRDVSSFFINLVRDTVYYREENNVERNDFMQLLINLKNNRLESEEINKHDGTTLTIEEMAAQSLLFFLAGYETSSTTMAFTLYELAKHQDIQDRLREEIKNALSKHNHKITYEAIQEMKYLGQVIDESLRMYPPGPVTSRKCIKDYKVPETDVIIEKDTLVFIPILGIHYDEKYFPDPENFDPERFSEENKKTRPSYAHIPFGEGPRNCIGLRFGLMQTKVGLVSLLRNYRFTVNEKTEEPLKMKPNSFVLAVEGEVWLNAQKM